MLGFGTIDHVLPSQCSVSEPALTMNWLPPTAQTSLPLPLTASNRLPVLSSGLATCDHMLPFQCSVSV